MMKTFFSTGAYRPPVMSAGTGITRMLLLFFCLLFATISADAATVKYGIKINGKEVTWGNKGTGWDASKTRGDIRFTRDRMPKKESDRYYRISGTATERLRIIVERDVKNCIFVFDDLNFKGYFSFQDCDFSGSNQTNWSSSPNTNTIRICGTNSITAEGTPTAPLNIDGQNIVIIESGAGQFSDKHYKLTLNGSNLMCPAIGSLYPHSGYYAKVIIKGGTVEANGGIESPGIGSYPRDQKSTPIRPIIEGGYVKAVGNGSPGIGGRWGLADMELKGGTVEASGQGNDIGFIGNLERNAGPDKLLISGGTMKTTNFNRITAYDADGNTRMYRVEIPLPQDEVKSAEESLTGRMYPSTCVKIKNLKVNGKDYGDEDLFPDNDGKVYIWLPNGNYEFSALLNTRYLQFPSEHEVTVGTYDYMANVNNNHTTAVQPKNFSPSIPMMTLISGQSAQIQPQNVPSDYHGTITYTSSNNSIVKVEGNQITGLTAGDANITATFPPNGHYRAQTCTFRVGVSIDLTVDDKKIIGSEDVDYDENRGWEYLIDKSISPTARTLTIKKTTYNKKPLIIRR